MVTMVILQSSIDHGELVFFFFKRLEKSPGTQYESRVNGEPARYRTSSDRRL